MQKRRIAQYDILFMLAAAALFPFFLWKCAFGYGGSDEPFYLTLAQRLSKKDALLCDEWNLSQLSGVLLLPLYRLHRLAVGSTEGIILHFRYLYTAAQFATALIVYLRLRRFTYGAAAAALVFLIYTPYDIMALSYNTMALMSMTLCLTFLATARSGSRIPYITAGVLYAFAVLSNPFVIFVYLTYICILIAALLLRKFPAKKKRLLPLSAFYLKELLFFTLGAAAVALPFLIFLLCRADLSDIFRNMRAILNDPEHASRGLRDVVYTLFYSMRAAFGSFLAVWSLILVLALLDRGRRRHAWMYFGMTALVCAIAVMTRIPYIQTDYNYIMFPVVMCGLTSYLLTSVKNHRVFFCLWCLGVIYTFFLGWASNQAENAICAGIPAAAVGSVILIREFVSETLSQFSFSRKSAGSSAGKTSRFTAPLVLCISLLFLLAQLGTECYAKASHAFWEPSVSELDTRITDGPLAGILTTREHAEQYNRLLADIADYHAVDEPVLFLTSKPWCYLYADRPYGVYSSWITTLSAKGDDSASEQLLFDRLADYYRLHPDKYPSDIYVAKNDLITFSVTDHAERWPDGYPLAAFLLAPADTDLSPLVPADSPAWQIFYRVRETANGYHLSKISP